eukprot:7641861-Pyramimonas_sp.AAC.1
MTNVFASVDHPYIDAAVDKICFPGDCAIMKGRHRRAACVTSDGIDTQGYQNTVGSFIGDADAAIKFRVSFMPPTAAWN